MATDDPTRSRAEAPASDDLRTERVVLAFLLNEHPNRLTVPGVALALDAKDFAEEDAISRAVRDLIVVGLLHLEGDLVAPTRAALHFDALGLD